MNSTEQLFLLPMTAVVPLLDTQNSLYTIDTLNRWLPSFEVEAMFPQSTVSKTYRAL